MKFERSEQFAPITITLESEEERDVLYTLLMKAPGEYADDMVYKLWGLLRDAGAQNKRLWTGRLRVALELVEGEEK